MVKTKEEVTSTLMFLAAINVVCAAVNLYVGVSLLQAGKPAAFQLAAALFCSLTVIVAVVYESKK